MAGGVRYGAGEDDTWLAAGWAFDEVMRRVRKHLGSAEAPQLGQELADMDEGAQPWLNLPGLPEAERAAFARAVQKAYQESAERGPAGFGSPELFPSFLEHFRELAEELKPLAPDETLRNAAPPVRAARTVPGAPE